MAVGERLLRRGDDVLGRREIRLADAQIDDAAPGLSELLGAREHLEGALRAEPGHPLCELHAALTLDRPSAYHSAP